jgi:hypothetical protein
VLAYAIPAQAVTAALAAAKIYARKKSLDTALRLKQVSAPEVCGNSGFGRETL